MSNQSDLPPAARLACLIEAGVAANPDLVHGTGRFLFGNEACALGYAALAAGADRKTLVLHSGGFAEVERVLGCKPTCSGDDLASLVMQANDMKRWPLCTIIESLREGELAKVPA